VETGEDIAAKLGWVILVTKDTVRKQSMNMMQLQKETFELKRRMMETLARREKQAVIRKKSDSKRCGWKYILAEIGYLGK
jgi:predicted Holliday junction resolvase-like endonuclease